MDNHIFDIPNICTGLVINRPSKTCKSPYVADVKVIDHQNHELINDDIIMAHTPALGCCGMVHPGKQVLMTKINKPSGKCVYSIIAHLAADNTIVLVHPLYSNRIWGAILEKQLHPKYSDFKSFKAECKIEESRFDFYGIKHDGKECYMEIKSAPLGSINLMDNKYKCCVGKDNADKRISFFPDGYRKKKGDPVSPRALKHIQHLTKLVDEGYDCSLIFVICRTDTNGFTISPWDPIYKNAVEDGEKAGVKIEVIRVSIVREDYELKLYLV